ncbi:hypothetical protein BRC81_05740 [Halobacteriales archaeon QS_1_68_20]|nr:MAG: hypothetical protein BRC81_05740 [Halobacteriales archaeon QS_1_68_20]
MTVTLVPEGQSDPSLDLSVRLGPQEAIEWDDNPLLDESGHVTVTVDDGTGETEQAEDDWGGDTDADNRKLRVLVKEDEIVVQQPVS